MGNLDDRLNKLEFELAEIKIHRDELLESFTDSESKRILLAQEIERKDYLIEKMIESGKHSDKINQVMRETLETLKINMKNTNSGGYKDGAFEPGSIYEYVTRTIAICDGKK